MESRLLSERSSVFHADPYAVSDYVNQHVGQHCIGLSRTTHPQASLSHRKFAELDLCRISYGGSVRVTSPALETIYHPGKCCSTATACGVGISTSSVWCRASCC